MTITLEQLGKRFNRQWIFRRMDARFETGVPVAITGQNGSGKSTLLQVLAGALQSSEGKMIWELNGQAFDEEKQFRLVAICAPYLELIEELTLSEFLQFHEKFKSWLQGISIEKVIELTGLQDAKDKQIRDFSSGMKQRVKLAQAILSDAPVLLLDEPTSNLDTIGVQMYHQWMEAYAANRILIIASNDETEIAFCKQRIHISDFKSFV